MRFLPLLLLVGCADPISNGVFYEEASFLAALPSRERFSAPDSFLDPPGDDPLLARASDAANDLQGLMAPLVICGETLAETEPDDREDTFRSWDTVPVLVPTDDGTYDWWVRGTVVKEPNGAFTWTLDGSLRRIGPWVELASGRHERSDAGEVLYHLHALGELVGVEAPGIVELRYANDGSSYGVEIQHYPDTVSTEPDAYWAYQGDDLMSWSGWFAITTDGATLPGVAIAGWAEDGGRADGVLWRTAEDTVVFGSCWDAGGDNVWTGGSPDVPGSGDAAACVMGSLFDQDAGR